MNHASTCAFLQSEIDGKDYENGILCFYVYGFWTTRKSSEIAAIFVSSNTIT